MKTIGCTIIFMGVYLLCTACYCQTHKKDKDSEKNLVNVPEWAFDDEREKIRKIEAKDTLAYNEYIQLSVSYAEIGENRLKISAMADSAFRINTEKSCNEYKFIIENHKDWLLTQKFNKTIIRKLKKYGCNDL